MDFVLSDIRLRRNVKYVGPLAGKSTGIHEENGERMLITGGPKLIAGDLGRKWPLIREFLDDLLAPGGGAQIAYFYSWLSVALKALDGCYYAPGQALAFAGPRDSGKNLVQDIIIAVLGGRSMDPYSYISGATSFNRELFGCETLAFGDAGGATNYRARRDIGSRIKQMTVNEQQHCHGKGREGLKLCPQWRIVLSLNSETENFMVLPPLDESIEDKIMLLRVRRPRIFSDAARWANSRREDWAKIESELPGFVAFIREWQIPVDLRDGRMGVKAYHDPELVESLKSIAPETRLLELIDMSDIFKGSSVMSFVQGEQGATRNLKDFWEGTTLQLEHAMRGDGVDSRLRDSLQKLLTYTGAMGSFLRRLSTKYPERFSSRTVNGNIVWKITRTTSPEDPKTAAA